MPWKSFSVPICAVGSDLRRDPNYTRKANALFHEFEEVGMNRQLGYESPADIVDRYPQFYWNSVAPHIQTEIRYLNMTSSGWHWIAGLYGSVFMAMSSARTRDIAFGSTKPDAQRW
jgi:hypothetical protein